MTESDHHSAYLARAVAALTPEGRRRVDELLDQLAGLVGDHPWLVAFANARRLEADEGQLEPLATEPAERLSEEELERLSSGFLQIRDQGAARRRSRLGERGAAAARGRAGLPGAF